MKLADIQPVPVEKLREVAAMAPEEDKPQREQFEGDRSGRVNINTYLDHYGVSFRIKQDGNRTIYNLDCCLFDESHIKNEASIIQNVAGLITYQCFHKSCLGYQWHDAREKISGSDSLAPFIEGGTKKTTVSFDGITPLDIFGSTALAGEPDLPFDALPEVIADYAWDRCERIGVTPAMVAMPCLAVGAAAASNNYRIQPKNQDSDWQEMTILWLAGVADISARKTTSQKAAL